MGYTIKNWEKIISTMDTRTLLEQELSLHSLLSWLGFKNAYGWTNLDILKTLIRCELDKRVKEEKEKEPTLKNIFGEWGSILFEVNWVYNK